MSSIEDLRKVRSNKRSQVTKKVNELKRLVAEDSYGEVVLKFDLVKGAFRAFEEAHVQYHDLLEDESDQIASDAYFEEVEGNYIGGLRGVREYIKLNASPLVTLQSKTDSSQTKTDSASSEPKSVSFVKLPPVPQPDIFSGKAELYPMWKASFNTLIGKHNIGYDEKMFYLKQYTSGEAQSAIEALFLCPDKSSYESALDILEQRFGNPSLVATAFRRKLESWPKIGERDGKGLQKFSDFLNQICVAKKSYKSLEILNDEFENRKILNKLPAWLVNKWIELVVKSDTFPDFEQFTKFISDKAKIANHALWSGHSAVSQSSGNKMPRSDSRSHQGQTHVTHTDSNVTQNTESQTRQRNCLVCDAAHTVAKCPVFSNMSLNDRKSFIRDKKMCFGCYLVGHHSKDCRNRHTCAVCSKRHPTLLHDYSYKDKAKANVVDANEQSNGDTTEKPEQGCFASYNGGKSVGVKTGNRATTMVLPVIVRHPSSDKELIVYALLDTQSNTNFITHEVADRLNVCGRKTSLDLTTMNGRVKSPTMAVDGLEVRGVVDGEYIGIQTCYMRPSIPCNRSNIPSPDISNKWPHLSHIDIPKYYDNAPVGLLIGYHCPQVLRPLDIVSGRDDEPFGWKTNLGWCVVGGDVTDECEVDDFGTSHFVQGCIAFKTECRETVLDVDEDNVFMPGMHERYSVEDVRFMEIMSEKMFQREDKHYEAPLPLKCESVFPENVHVAQRRLRGLRKRFERDSEFHERYSAVMREMLDSKFAEIVPPEESAPRGRIWYIPHHGVQQPNKLRVVFDCSSECQGVSLNERLLQGPNMMNLLLGILFRFRLEPIAFTCDIQKMYYQFMVSPGDRDLLRYLWWKDDDFRSDPVAFRMRVHLFGATSSPGVATYALRKIAVDHGSKYCPEASEFVHKNFYVDDGVTSVSSVSSACALIAETQKLLAEGGCKCHKVMSNSKEVLESVSMNDRAQTTDSNLHKTLGIFWNVESDNLHFSFNFDHDKVTRRGLLSNLAKFYDPLGVISPLIHQAKLLLHQMCQQKYGWDDALSGELLKDYEKWRVLLSKIEVVEIPRCVRSSEKMFSVQMHHFADASSTGYSACSYLRFLDENGDIHVVFMLGKCRVVPFKPVLSVVRLELVAAVLSVQLASTLRKELPFQYDEFFWTDSMVVLAYIKNVSSRFKIFVANRVQRIHDGSRPEQWFHVDSKDNPADDGSRAVWSKRWLVGPEFLRFELNVPDVNPELSPGDVEVKCLSSQGDEPPGGSRISVSRSWFSTLKIWAWVSRFIENCRGRRHQGDLTIEEIDKAKVLVVRMVQRSCFHDDIIALLRSRRVSKSSRLLKLDVFLDGDGLIRVGGRIRHSSFPDYVKYPVVLPSDHVVTSLIVQHFHQKSHHQGRGITCSEVRGQGFWILSLQSVVKKLIRSCGTCSRLRGKPVEQKMADLPEERLCPSFPFWFSGCDLFGPFLVKSGRREVKRYGVLFTCLASRAVHIEVVHSLSTDSFLNAFRRFVALRGSVREIRCDQGTNFVGAKNELLKMGCDMVFNPPASSHRGGIWERLIGAARRVIEGILCEHGSRFDDEGLMTILSEAASVINSRPLNVDNLSDPQSLEPLTPNHLITMKSKVIPKSLAPVDLERSDLYASRQWRRVQYLIDLFWSRWKKEIIQQHMSRVKWNRPRQNLKLGDIVLVVDDQSHRLFWKLARVSEAYMSQDGLVRSVKVRFADGSLLHRPVQKLIKLLND